MSASSLSAVTAWLVNNIAALPECAGAVVSDGFPATDSNFMVIVGTIGEEGESAMGSQTWAGLGAKHKDEDYTVTSEIYVSTGDPTGQAAVRGQAFDVLNAIEALVRTDPTLGGLVKAHPGAIESWRLEQTDPPRAAQGRFARLFWTLHVTNRI